MNPQALRTALQYAVWIIVIGGGLLFFLDRDSAEFVITVFSVGLGVIFLAVVLFLLKRSMK